MGYNYLNSFRNALGMILLQRNIALEKAASSHAAYLEYHQTHGHMESQDSIGFSGENAGRRAVHFGHATYDVKENIAYSKDLNRSIVILFATIYHRLGFMDWSIDEVGIGFVKGGVAVFDMGSSALRKICEKTFAKSGRVFTNVCKRPLITAQYQKAIQTNQKQNPPIISWPVKDIPVVPFAYPESPNLLHYKIVGYPITVRFNPYYFSKPPKIVAFSLQDMNGTLVQILQQIDSSKDPTHIFSDFDFAFVPKVLEWDKRYRAVLIYRYRGKEYLLRWYFSTKKLPKNFLQANQKLLFVHPNVWYNLYWRAQSPQDKIITYRYYCSKSVEVEGYIKDINTIALCVRGEIGQRVKIVLSNGESIFLYLRE
nr:MULTISPECIES: CAP domain-containing protein [unclassified Nitratiruptor]